MHCNGGTPVVFLNDCEGRYNAKLGDSANGRYEGLMDFFNVMEFSKVWQLTPRFSLRGVIKSAVDLPVKSNWRCFADKLSEACQRFVERIGQFNGESHE